MSLGKSSDYCAAVRAEIGRMADAVRGVDPATPVPSCPEWTVADLVKHTGTVHRWAGRMLRDLASERVDPGTIDLGLPDDPIGYADWSHGTPAAAPLRADANERRASRGIGRRARARLLARTYGALKCATITR